MRRFSEPREQGIARLARVGALGTSSQGIFSAALLVSGSLIASRVLGLLRLSIFASLFGTSTSMAAYNAAFRIPDLLFTIVAGGALASAFIPVFSGLLEVRQEETAWRVANTVLNTLLVTLVILAALCFVFAPELVRALVPSFSHSEQLETASLTRIMLVQPVLLGIGGLFAAMQNSYGRFILPSVAPVLYNAAIIVGAVVFGPRYGVYAAAWAVVGGAVVMFEIQIWGVVWESVRYRPTIDWRLTSAREVLRLLGPRLIGLSAFQFMLLVTTFLASGLTSAGFNAITYAWSLVMFPVGAVGSALGTAVFPTLSRQSATAQRSALEHTVSRSIQAILFLALPATAGLILLRHPVITLLFDHGAWTPASTAATSFALVFYALAIAPLALIEVAARSFYALRNTKTPVMLAVGATLVDAVLSVVLIHLFPRDRGQGGLALATAISVWLQVVLLIRALRVPLPHVAGSELRRACKGMALATIGMSACVYAAFWVLSRASSSSTLWSGTEVVLPVCIGVLSYLWLAKRLGLPEADRILGMLNRARRSA